LFGPLAIEQPYRVEALKTLLEIALVEEAVSTFDHGAGNGSGKTSGF